MSKFQLRLQPTFFQTARRVTTPLGLVYVQNNQLQPGVVVIAAKKNFPLAVDRHAIKRRFRSSFASLAAGGYQVVVVVNRAARTVTTDQINQVAATLV